MSANELKVNANEIAVKRFEMVLRGYKTEEVEEFLSTVSIDFSRLQKKNDELEAKLDVLAEKIREYREDEDTLKDALLGAQRQGNALIADSKRKAAEIIENAQNEAAEIVRQAEEAKQGLLRQGEEAVAAAEQESADIIAAANNKADEIERAMNLRTDTQKEILHRTTTEVSEHTRRILAAYKEHMAVIERISEECINEFIKDTLAEGPPDMYNRDNQGGRIYRKDKNKNKGKNNRGDVSATAPLPKAAASSSKSEQAEPEQSKPEQSKPEQSKPEQAQPEQALPEIVEMESTAEITPESGAMTINDDTIKFEINVNDESGDETVEVSVGNVNSGGGSKSGNGNGSGDVFFKKTKGGKNKNLKFGGNNGGN